MKVKAISLNTDFGKADTRVSFLYSRNSYSDTTSIYSLTYNPYFVPKIGKKFKHP